MVSRNIFANYVGQGWSAVMGLVFIPIYIKYLGIEAYGLIGLFAVMQASVALLDMGMTPTLNREMARYTGGAHSAQSIRVLLRSLEAICFTLAIGIAVGVWAASGYLASDWLNAKRLSTELVARVLAIMALVTALKFCEGIYRGSLFGLQQQVWYNGVNGVLSTLRYAGAVAVLAWVSPTIEAFFIWQGVISLLTVVVLAGKVHRALPKTSSREFFSRQAIAGVWKFASGMMGIGFLSLLLTQVDKVALSRLLPLESYGYYTLAATVASAILMMVVPLNSALFPRMVELMTCDDQEGLVSLYHGGAQLVTVLTAPTMVLISFFAEGIIFTWSGDIGLAEHTAPILTVLVVGTFLNGLMQMPYHLQLAHGWIALSIKVNIVAVILLIPAILWVVPRFGAIGAAWIWVVLNGGYVLFTIQFMHYRLIPNEKWRWYLSDIVLPISGAIGVMVLAQQLQPDGYQDRLWWLIFLGIVGVFALAASLVLADRIRSQVITFVGLSPSNRPRAARAFLKKV